MRQTKAFKLINGTGAELDISSDKLFFTNVSGIGFTKTNKYQTIGTHLKKVSESIEQDSISGDMDIYGDDSAHDEYKRLVDFCMVSPLKLVYIPQKKGREYMIDVSVNSISINKRTLGKIEAKVKFDTESLMYRDAYSSTLLGGTGKTYPYTYPYQYNDIEKGTAYVDVDSSCESGTVIEIFGPCTNPTWKYYIEGQLIGDGKANLAIEDGNKLVIDTTTIPYSVNVMDLSNQLVSNAYNDCDFSTKRFFLAKKGRNRVSVINGAKAEASVLLKVRIEYASV